MPNPDNYKISDRHSNSSFNSSIDKANNKLNLKIPLPNRNFDIHTIENISSPTVPTLLLVISDESSIGHRGQPSRDVKSSMISLGDHNIQAAEIEKLQIIIYNDQEADFTQDNLTTLQELVISDGWNAHESLCDGITKIEEQKEPDEGCGGVLGII